MNVSLNLNLSLSLHLNLNLNLNLILSLNLTLTLTLTLSLRLGLGLGFSEVVPKTDASSLGLTPTVPLSVEYLREVTGPSTAAMRNPCDVGSGSIENVISGANVAETTASGLQTPRDGKHPKESTTRS